MITARISLEEGVEKGFNALINEREKITGQYLVIMQIGFVKTFSNFLQTRMQM